MKIDLTDTIHDRDRYDHFQ